MIEHHFSDYFPTPNPLAFLSHIAARFPDFALGTCVLVTPWYEPLRLAEEIAQLNLLTDQPLHLGLGRGTAKYEYDAFGVPMEESRQRFREVWEIVSTALAGGRFRYEGQHLSVPTRVELRPPLRHEQDQLLRRRRRQPGVGHGDGLARPPADHDGLQQSAAAARGALRLEGGGERPCGMDVNNLPLSDDGQLHHRR